MTIRIPELWDTYNRFRGVFLRASKSLYEQRIKIQEGVRHDLQLHMEVRLLASELLRMRSVFWY